MNPISLPTFISLHSYSASGYACTNEEPELFRELLKGKVFKRAATICSGGEIPLFILLPRTTQELVAVDHSKRSLLATYIKVLILDMYGAKEGKEILTTLTNPESITKAEKVSKSIPDYLLSGLYTNQHPISVITNDRVNITREWKLAREQDLKASIKKFHLLKLIQGDITDLLKDHNPFELFYFSNAFEHLDRGGKYLNPRKVEQLVIPGGYILTCAGSSRGLEEGTWCSSGGKKIALGWNTLNILKGRRSSWSNFGLHQTNYTLHQIPSEVRGVCGGLCDSMARKIRVNQQVQRYAV